MSDLAKEPPGHPSLAETPGDVIPQVAFASSGLPTWALGAAAVVFGGVVMGLMLAGRHAEPPARARSEYAGSVTIAPPLPPGLQGGIADVLPESATAARLDAGADRDDLSGAYGPFGPYGYAPVQEGAPAFAMPVLATPAQTTPATSTPALPAQSSTARFEQAMRRSAGTASPGAWGGFSKVPMPGGPLPGSVSGAGGNGTSIVFDATGPAGTAGGEDKLTGDTAPVRASILRNRSTIVSQGELVAATLETPASSDRPGLIRGIVSRDVRSFDGSRVLIPRGSRLIGEFRADQQQGRRRLLATWSRLIRPDGVAIRLDSPSADSTGAIGIAGKVDTHFLARFANAALQSAMQIGVNLANRGTNSVIISGNQLPGTLSQNIVPNADAPPRVSVAAGAAITVFVARDLDFSGVPLVR
jgi:type IV secretion system protein VirB10